MMLFTLLVCLLLTELVKIQELSGMLLLFSVNNQQMQLYAVNFIPLLGSFYMFRVFYAPIIRSTILKIVSTTTGTDHSIVSATYCQRGLQGHAGSK